MTKKSYYNNSKSTTYEFPISKTNKENMERYMEERGDNPFYSVIGHKQCASYANNCAKEAGVDLGVSGYVTPRKIENSLKKNSIEHKVIK